MDGAQQTHKEYKMGLLSFFFGTNDIDHDAYNEQCHRARQVYLDYINKRKSDMDKQIGLHHEAAINNEYQRYEIYKPTSGLGIQCSINEVHVIDYKTKKVKQIDKDYLYSNYDGDIIEIGSWCNYRIEPMFDPLDFNENTDVIIIDSFLQIERHNKRIEDKKKDKQAELEAIKQARINNK